MVPFIVDVVVPCAKVMRIGSVSDGVFVIPATGVFVTVVGVGVKVIVGVIVIVGVMVIVGVVATPPAELFGTLTALPTANVLPIFAACKMTTSALYR